MTQTIDDANATVFSQPEWQAIQRKVPIACVDVIAARFDSEHRMTHFGLILRKTPFGKHLWCHMGGRVRKDETTRLALMRHINDTLADAAVALPVDPQPGYVMQWFPSSTDNSGLYGHDPRKHAIALCFLIDVDLAARARAGGEGLEFKWFDVRHQLPTDIDLWPGTAHMLGQLVHASGETLARKNSGAFGSEDAGALTYQVVSDRAVMHNSLMWQTPGLAIAAEAFLLTLALSPGTSVISRCLTAGLSLVLSVLCIQLMAKHSAMEKRDRDLMNYVEESLGLIPTHPKNQVFKGVARLRSRTLWHIGLGIFAAASVFILVAALVGVDWFG